MTSKISHFRHLRNLHLEGRHSKTSQTADLCESVPPSRCSLSLAGGSFALRGAVANFSNLTAREIDFLPLLVKALILREHRGHFARSLQRFCAYVLELERMFGLADHFPDFLRSIVPVQRCRAHTSLPRQHLSRYWFGWVACIKAACSQ